MQESWTSFDQVHARVVTEFAFKRTDAAQFANRRLTVFAAPGFVRMTAICPSGF